MTTIVELITILKNRLEFLASSRVSAVTAGDLATVNDIDRQVLETKESLAKLEA
jgi:hypothetical protein